MAVALTQIERFTVFGDRRVKIYDLTFSGNYATDGEALTPATLGLSRLDALLFDGVAVAADGATALGVKYDYAASKVMFYEGSAAGTALSEKTNGEAYPTGCVVRVMAVGIGS